MHPNKVVHDEASGLPKSPRRFTHPKEVPEDKIPISRTF